MIRLAINVSGVVQDVGFWSFVHTLATRQGLLRAVLNEQERGLSLVQAYVAALGRDARRCV